MPNHPTETKVIAASGTSAVGGGAVGTFVLWLLGTVVWSVPNDSAHADSAISAVPWPVSVFVLAALAGGSAFLGGYFSRHSPREQVTTPPGGQVPALLS